MNKYCVAAISTRVSGSVTQFDAKPELRSERASLVYCHPNGAHRDVNCHNEFAPYNMVVSNVGPISILDFDPCCHGPRVHDLAYLAYWMTRLSFAPGALWPFSETMQIQIAMDRGSCVEHTVASALEQCWRWSWMYCTI